MSALLVPVRALWVLWLLLLGLALTAGTALLQAAGRRCEWWPALVSWEHRQLLRALDLRLVVHGTPADAALMIANHISWLDIPVLGGLAPVTFLSKSEVRDWPLLGWLTVRASTLFIERGANQTAGLPERIAATIHGGRPLVLFAEGTTSTGEGVRPFYPRLFAAAQQPGIRVQPVALRYGTNAAPDPVAPFVGDDDLVPHLLNVLRHPGMRVEVSFLPVIEPLGLDRRALAEQTRTAIAAALGVADPAATLPRRDVRHKAAA